MVSNLPYWRPAGRFDTYLDRDRQCCDDRRCLGMRGVFDQRPDVPDPLRMSARELAELNDRILVHEEGQRVQPPL